MESIVGLIIVKLKEDNLHGAEIMDSLSAVSSTDALFNALSPLYAMFCRKNNQDKLLECFYGLIPCLCKLSCCGNYKVTNLVMIHIPEHLIAFYNTCPANEEASSNPSTPAQLHQAECGPLCYVAGYNCFSVTKKETGRPGTAIVAASYEIN